MTAGAAQHHFRDTLPARGALFQRGTARRQGAAIAKFLATIGALLESEESEESEGPGCLPAGDQAVVGDRLSIKRAR